MFPFPPEPEFRWGGPGPWIDPFDLVSSEGPEGLYASAYLVLQWDEERDFDLAVRSEGDEVIQATLFDVEGHPLVGTMAGGAKDAADPPTSIGRLQIPRLKAGTYVLAVGSREVGARFSLSPR